MEKILQDRIQLTIKNYRAAKENLRNDGDLLNHFASLVYAHYEKEIPVEKVREIRKYIKATSSRVSPFRGDTLYILSLLIALEEGNEKELVDNIYNIMDILVEENFKECDHLVLTSFVIAKYGKNKDKYEVIRKMKDVYIILKEKYYNITQEDDYLVCALWALNDIDIQTIDEFIEVVYEQMSSLQIKSKNGVQGLANAIMLNGSSGDMYRTIEFILQLEKRDLKIAQQFLPVLGVLSNVTPRKNADIVEGVIDILCEEEAEYEYYMDKGFRTIIAISIVAFCTISEKRRYIDELLAHGVYCFIQSKNKGIFSEVLA
ncbi:DUF4003 family protein [Clostridium chauvoei]|uniref:DUF4003 domain-containing protein n=2 Tax=Clostridium chauvoei TaxID=46867 RepID=S6EJ80_9CLOT|nr:DUF4003 family protein [Clostridium chauvoei]ATD54671.1 hypothetical protein BTM20_05235 [Clostridium chauvoei]ATD57647.1 hypothetical protein BTM21_07820 [Clostridium chauvoei]MBX7279967.1 DUF4003 domain-containing protein [Clostridium chauvoei]MBX7282374.1 DUF4003 domain-containing protein [Clostridium chauvoei]MBX7284858.1 DUF4003 domain-containing protein [Clostridium chauvoei]